MKDRQLLTTALPLLLSVTSVGVSVILGRLPGSILLGCAGLVLRQRTRLDWVTPEGPGRLPSMLHEGVAATMLPDGDSCGISETASAQNPEKSS